MQTVREAHDISLALQQSIEQLSEVERAFVHVDYQAREGEDEHNAKLIAEKVKEIQSLINTTPPAAPGETPAVTPMPAVDKTE